MFHPWRRISATPEMNVKFTKEPVTSCYNFRHQRATIASDGLQADRRCDANHEWHHHDRGPLPAGSTKQDRDLEERIIEVISARELITIEALGEAMAWTSDMAEVAEELWVDLPCLWARLSSLTLEERTFLDRRVYKVTGTEDDVRANVRSMDEWRHHGRRDP